MQKLTPGIALQLLRGSLKIVRKTLVPIFQVAIRARGPDKLRQRLGQHTPLLLTRAQRILRLLLSINTSTCTNPFDNRTLLILPWYSLDKKPMIDSCRCIAQAYFDFMGSAALQRSLPDQQCLLAIIGMKP